MFAVLSQTMAHLPKVLVLSVLSVEVGLDAVVTCCPIRKVVLLMIPKFWSYFVLSVEVGLDAVVTFVIHTADFF